MYITYLHILPIVHISYVYLYRLLLHVFTDISISSPISIPRGSLLAMACAAPVRVSALEMPKLLAMVTTTRPFTAATASRQPSSLLAQQQEVEQQHAAGQRQQLEAVEEDHEAEAEPHLRLRRAYLKIFFYIVLFDDVIYYIYYIGHVKSCVPFLLFLSFPK